MRVLTQRPELMPLTLACDVLGPDTVSGLSHAARTR